MGPLGRLAVLAAVAVLAACCASQASAHASLVSTSPRDGAAVASPPKQVRVRFDDPVTVGPGNAVVAADRRSVLAGSPRVASGGRELVLPLQRLGDGDYSVRWAIVSDDGHFESGSLAFRVGSEQLGAGAPRSVLAAESDRPSGGDLVARWLFLGGILVAGGVALFRLLVSRAGARQAAATLVVALSGVVGGGIWLLQMTPGGTRFAQVTAAAVVIAAVGAVAAALSLAYPCFQTVAAGASLALLAAPTLAGHAFGATSERPLSVAADLVHVVAAAFWVGGLLQLAVVVSTAGDPRAARRFSRLALPAVALIALSGLAGALVELTSVSQLWSTGYGRTLLVKTGLFASLIVLAFFSRQAIGSAMRLLRTVAAELAVLALVIGAVAVLTTLRPGRDADAEVLAVRAEGEVAAAPATPTGSVTFARESGALAVALAVRPVDPLRLVATVIGPSGQRVDGLDVELRAASAGHGATASATPCGHGCYAASLRVSEPRVFEVEIGRTRKVAFPVTGIWPPPSGTTFLRRATRAFRGLRSAVYQEHLASRPGTAIDTTWKVRAPNRIAYQIRGGAGGIVIGGTRWDRPAPGAHWQRSETEPLEQPFPPWGTRAIDARLLRATKSQVTLSWLDPGVPAWFTGTFDRTTALPRELRMTAAAHFMRQRYVAYNRSIEIEPPPPG